MKMSLLSATAAFMTAMLLSPAPAWSQGSLTPPGAPAPTFKTLNQVEPRTNLVFASLPVTITQPGSYYITNNLTGVSGDSGIVISANNVTLDLMGFTLTGVSGSLSGISVPAAQNNITIRNGNLVNWGGYGINASNASYCQISQIYVISNAAAGLTVGSGCLIDHCGASSNSSSGIITADSAVLNNCTSIHNGASGGSGISAGTGSTVTACVGSFNVPTNLTIGVSAVGINLGSNSVIKNCSVVSNNLGISTGAGCRIRDCTANDNISFDGDQGGVGFNLGDGSSISGCEAYANAYAGIQCDNYCSISDNNCTGNAIDDLYIAGTGNTIVHNFVSSAGVDVLNANNLVGTTVTSSSSMNSGVNPHANFQSP
jgi:hypothetical protein